MGEASVPGYAPTTEKGLARTDMHCHNCEKGFIAQLDFSVAGNHRIVCPRCGHIHYRFIKDGLITEQRWMQGYDTVDVSPQSTWKVGVLAKQNSVAAQFIRDAWLNRSEGSL